MAVDPEITELLRQINLAREALRNRGPANGDHKLGLKVAQDIAQEALRDAGWLPQ
jgi:hypothetical protein